MNVVLYLTNFGLFSLSIYKENWGAAAFFGLVCIVMALALLAKDLVEAIETAADKMTTEVRHQAKMERASRGFHS